MFTSTLDVNRVATDGPHQEREHRERNMNESELTQGLSSTTLLL